MTFTNQLDDAVLKQRRTFRKEDHRGHYFRDITAIIHSYPFRRLKKKTQVFVSPKNDHICTRVEHVLHVATISATLCRAFHLDVDLAWAVSLGHDLGHAPFGHVGEEILNDLLNKEFSFIHEIYSLRVVDYLINYGEGLNLTYAVRDGIVNHCGELFEQELQPDFQYKDLDTITARDAYPSTWEGVIVRVADKIAYLGRDLEDAIQLGLLKADDVPRRVGKILGQTNSQIIDRLVNDVIGESRKRNCVAFSDAVWEALLELKEFNYQRIYANPVLSHYHKDLKRILTTIFEYLSDLLERNRLDFAQYKRERRLLAARFGDYLEKMLDFYQNVDGSYDNAVMDYIAGMTDDYALDCIKEIMMPFDFEYNFGEVAFRD